MDISRQKTASANPNVPPEPARLEDAQPAPSEPFGPGGFLAHFDDPLIVVNELWLILFLNPAAERLFRDSPDRSPGRELADLWPASVRDDLDRKHRESLRNGVTIPVRNPFSNGTQQWMGVRAFRCDLGIVAHYSDVTDQGRLTETRNHLISIVESEDDAIVTKDLNGTILSWNRGAERIFGYKAEEAVGRHISMLAAPEAIDEIPRILQRIAAGERVDHYETKRVTKDGRVLAISLTVSPLRDASGAIIGASKVARDISDIRKIPELQERLAAIVESSDDAMLSKDLNGIIRSWNRGAERLFGYTSAETIGKHISMLAAPDVIDEFPNILARIRRGEKVDHYETRRKAKDGRILTVSLTVSPIRDASGAIIGASKVARDITEQKLHEQVLQTANDALTRANEDLQQFVYSASHDLQEPLRMVSIYCELLKQKFTGKLGRSGDEYIDIAVAGALRMEQLLRDLRLFTQASTMQHEPPPLIDAAHTAARVLKNIELLVRENAAVVTFGALPHVRIHKFQLEQILQNLIGNGIRYRGIDPPSVHVAAERQGREWVFAVTDNGIGIEPQYQEQIFGIFQRLHNAAEYPGTGMGLAICQRIINRIGGRIWVNSEPGRGSTFSFTIPCGED
jgi:PAS domain S-box-containing protein